MHRSHGGAMRSLVSFLGGAVSVGLVVGILAVAGVIDDDPAPPATPTTAAPSPPTASTPKSENSSPGSAPKDISELYKRVSPGVVFIQAGQSATGSGWVYDDKGHIVTNDHVVEEANSFTVRIGNEAKPIPATLVGKDPSSDLAAPKADPAQ